MRLIAAAISSLVLLGAGVSTSQAALIPASGPATSPGPVVTGGNTYGGSTTNNTAPGTNAFDDGVFFSSLSAFQLDTSILTSLTKPSSFANISYGLYRGVFGSGTLVASITANQAANKKSATGDYTSGTLAAGSYYFELSGNTKAASSVTNTVSFSVSAVPLPGALPMFGAALLALSGVAFMRSRKGSDKSVGASTVAA